MTDRSAVHHIDRFACEEGLEVSGGDIDEAGAGFAAGPGDVGGDEAVLGGEERVVGFGGFDGEDVEASSGDAAFVEGFGEGGFIDEGAAAGVDDHGLAFHEAEGALADEVLGGIGERAVEADDVGQAEDVVDFGGGDTGGWGLFPGALGGEDLHAEGDGDARDGAADFAVTDDAEGAAGELDDGVIPVGEIGALDPAASFHAL